ncbi:MAG: exopolyphosphatase [Deltaproteobacteria bacterium]|nr:exopolyphosphatase [Deltaproteobacteria bacterium]
MRLVTRSDFDGLACAAILEEMGVVDEVFYTHPKDIQDGKIAITGNDVLANVPFVPGCGLWFDHHSSEQERLDLEGKFKGACEPAPSAARVVYDYYAKDPANTEKLKKFTELLTAVNKADSADFSPDEVENPKGWILLSLIADPRTGLGYRHQFKISNFDLMKSLPALLREKSADEILAMPDFAERVDAYFEENSKYLEFIKGNSRVAGNAIIIDMRGKKEIPAGNRFLEYGIFPDANISIRLADARDKTKTMISIGHSIINKTSTVDVGSLALKYGGGGHKKVGTCQVAADQVDEIVDEILSAINL